MAEDYMNKNSVKNIFLIILGSFIAALGINVFIVNAHLLSGGVSGIALIVQYVFQIPAGYTVLAINIPLLILSYVKMEKRFTIYTILGTISISVGLILTKHMNSVITFDDPLLLGIYGGILNGIGVGLGFSNHGSTGGLDIVSFVLKKKYKNFDIGKITFGVNFLIVAVGAFVFDIKSALYTLVSMYITSYFIDKVIKGFDNREKLIFIITNKEDEVSGKIMSGLRRGVTFLYGAGAYTKQERKVIYCIILLSQLPELKQIVKEIDEDAFISIVDVSEVDGIGFRKTLN